jgi:acyl-CoA thioester hydrolase
MQLRVRFYELDPYNHVNHSVYVQYFETARVELLDQVGFSLASMRRDGLSIVVSEINTKFIAAAEESDVLTIETEVLEFRRVTSKWRQRILRGDELIATQELRAAMITLGGKPTRFPPEMLEVMKPFMATH